MGHLLTLLIPGLPAPLMKILNLEQMFPCTGARAMGAQQWKLGKHHPLGKKANQLALWLDASDLTTAGSTWSDKSGNANHATKNGSPTLVTNVANGHGVMRYSGADADYHEWTDMTDIRTIFWIARADHDSAGFMLGDDDKYFFHTSAANSSSTFWHSSQGPAAAVRGGTTRLSGTEIDGTATTLTSSLSSLSLLSLCTSANVEASRFSRDRNEGGRNWKGDLGELIIFNSALDR
jgi:hypothetical protein